MGELDENLGQKIINNLPLIIAVFVAFVCIIAVALKWADDKNIGFYIIALLISLSWYIIQRYESIKRTSDKIDKFLLKKPSEALESISANILTLKYASDITELCKEEYKNINSVNEYLDFRKKQVEHLKNQLQSYKDKGIITNLSPEDTFDITTKLFTKIGMDDENEDYIKAVSFLEKDEWKEETYWKVYVASQQIAATKRNVNVQRIFITNLDDLKKKLNYLDVVRRHAFENYKETHLRGYFLDEEKEPYDEDLMGHGFLLIKSKNEYLAVIDHFGDKKKVGKTDVRNDEDKFLCYKTELVFDKDRLNRIEDYFDQRVNGDIGSQLPCFKLDGSLVLTKVKKK